VIPGVDERYISAHRLRPIHVSVLPDLGVGAEIVCAQLPLFLYWQLLFPDTTANEIGAALMLRAFATLNCVVVQVER
jgi:hypothetical protein